MLAYMNYQIVLAYRNTKQYSKMKTKTCKLRNPEKGWPYLEGLNIKTANLPKDTTKVVYRWVNDDIFQIYVDGEFYTVDVGSIDFDFD